ncbi:MAG: tRNA (adenosine(37)-N6)-threonylcarbamoyltransferase complex transferase subunit TsaD [Pseudomonadota bacterium]
MADAIRILGIETSCDDTAVAMLEEREGSVHILSNVVYSQDHLHQDFGGVVPEIAARAHAERIDLVIERAMTDAGCDFTGLDAIAVTAGPGLIGGVLSGSMAAKGLAFALGKPILAVNHLAGHALTPRLTDGLEFPYLLLLVSGGHCQFLRVEGPQEFHRFGGTIDDAPGEAFDKVARLLGLGQPGGPAVENAAKTGVSERFDLPRPMLDRAGYDLSFSGLKTAILRLAQSCQRADGSFAEQDRADLAAGFQRAVADVLVEKTSRVLKDQPDLAGFAVAGGVAANTELRARLTGLAVQKGLRFVAPPLALCTDNGAMIAYAGLLAYKEGERHLLDFPARPRWPLDASAAPMLGSGKRGAKA